MILVDSSVWIDHLRRQDAELLSLLTDQRVMCHPFVVGEMACGFLRQRQVFLNALALLPRAPAASHDEAMHFAERHAIAGSGIGWTDVHLLASTSLAGVGLLWTRDKRLAALAASLGLLHQPRQH